MSSAPSRFAQDSSTRGKDTSDAESKPDDKQQLDQYQPTGHDHKPTQLMDSEVLPILLQHACMHHSNIVCMLLCTSKALSCQLLHLMRGQVKLECHSMMDWRPRNVWKYRPNPTSCILGQQGLYSALHLDINFHGMLREAMVKAVVEIAAAIQSYAKQNSGGLILQSYAASATSVYVLPSLPISLTSLNFGILVWDTQDNSRRSHLDDVAKSLARLTNLEELAFGSSDYETLMPAVCQLKQLTSLRLQDLSQQTISNLHILPQRLKVLQFRRVERSSLLQAPAMQLSHLTSLTKLECSEMFGACLLPASLKILNVEYLHSVQPLQALTSLQRISVRKASCNITPSMFGQLSQLTCLTCLQLQYCLCFGASKLTGHADVWPRLPLCALGLQWVADDEMPRAVFEQLPMCVGLTRLQLEISNRAAFAASLQHLTAALSRLRALQEFDVKGPSSKCAQLLLLVQPQHGASMKQNAGSLQLMLEALQGLRGLRSLHLRAVVLSCEHAVELGALTQLTALHIQGEGVAAAVGSVTKLTRLVELTMDIPAALTVEQLPAIAQELDCLTKITYVIDDIDAAKMLWKNRGGVVVRHILPACNVWGPVTVCF